MTAPTGIRLLRDEGRQTTLEAIATPAIITAPRRFRTRMHKASAGGPAGEIAAAREWMHSSDDPDESAWATLHLGIVLQRHKHFKEAEQRLREARSTDHATVRPAAAAILGLLLKRRGRSAQARAMFEEVLTSGHPQLVAMAAAELGTLLLEKGDLAGAEPYLRKAVDSSDRDIAACAGIELGILLLKRGNDVDAAHWYRKALKSGNPQIVRAAANNLGALHTDRSQYRRATAMFRRAAAAGSQLAIFNLGALQLSRGNRAAAEKYFHSAVGSKDPIAASAAATKLGIILLEQNKTEAAEAMFRRGIEARHPDYALATFSLGVLLERRGEAVEAERLLRLAVKERDPQVSPTAAVKLAQLLMERGREEQVKRLLEEAMASQHPDAAAMAAFELGSLLRRRKRFDEARKAYEQALAHGGEAQVPGAIELTALLREQGKPAEADARLDHIVTVILSRPGSASAAEAQALQLVDGLLQGERLEEARTVLSRIRQAKKATDRSTTAAARLIASLRDQGRLVEAGSFALEWEEPVPRSPTLSPSSSSAVGNLLATGGLSALTPPHPDGIRPERPASISSIRELLRTGGLRALSTGSHKGQRNRPQRPADVAHVLASGGLDLFLRDP